MCKPTQPIITENFKSGFQTFSHKPAQTKPKAEFASKKATQ